MDSVNTLDTPVQPLTSPGLEAPVPSAARRGWHLPILIALSGFLFFYHLAERDLWSSHEARAAQDAQSVLDDHQWGLPRLFDGRLELQKPPLYYWLVALL